VPGRPHLTLPARPHRLSWCIGPLFLLVSCGESAVELDAPELDQDAARACATLVEELPEQVADQDRRTVEPSDAPGAAWGDPAIELVCGVPKPDGFTRTSICTTVDGVDWYVPEEQLEQEGDLVMTLVNREQYVEVRMPAAYWPPATTLADLGQAISTTLDATGSCY
jgi:hypothetical protein